MELATAKELLSETGQQALAAAAAQPDPSSFAAATAMRRSFSPELAAAALSQHQLRSRAITKFGAAAADWYFTPAGLEQATRPAVADYRAARLVAAGVRRVVDLGCGIGADLVACAQAGLQVVGVERDPVTARLAAANLGERGQVLIAAVETVAEGLLKLPGTAAFCDPARRNSSGRVWRIADLSPPWEFVQFLLGASSAAVIKLGPGLPHSVIPSEVEAEWISDHADVVEVALWSGAGSTANRFRATLLPDNLTWQRDGPQTALPTAPIGRYLAEPNGAIIRAGLIGTLGTELGASLIDPNIAYLTADQELLSPAVQGFEVMEVLDFKEQTLRAWLRQNQVGTLEIKQRGVRVDPERLRKRLRLAGSESLTMIITRTPAGAVAVVARRLSRSGPE